MAAVIRPHSLEDADAMIKAAHNGGFRIFEISLQTPQAFRLLEACSKKENLLTGAGTVTDGEMAHRAVHAGAKFLSSQYLEPEVVIVAKNSGGFSDPRCFDFDGSHGGLPARRRSYPDLSGRASGAGLLTSKV